MNQRKIHTMASCNMMSVFGVQPQQPVPSTPPTPPVVKNVNAVKTISMDVDWERLTLSAISVLRARPAFREHVDMLYRSIPNLSKSAAEVRALLDVCHSEPAAEWNGLQETLERIIDGTLFRKVDIPSFYELRWLPMEKDHPQPQQKKSPETEAAGE